jgi:hypothetical protein
MKEPRIIRSHAPTTRETLELATWHTVPFPVSSRTPVSFTAEVIWLWNVHADVTFEYRGREIDQISGWSDSGYGYAGAISSAVESAGNCLRNLGVTQDQDEPGEIIVRAYLERTPCVLNSVQDPFYRRPSYIELQDLYIGDVALMNRIQAFWKERGDLPEGAWAPNDSALKVMKSEPIIVWSSRAPVDAETARARFLAVHPEPAAEQL